MLSCDENYPLSNARGSIDSSGMGGKEKVENERVY